MKPPLYIGIICNRLMADIGPFQAVNHFYLRAVTNYMQAIPLLIPTPTGDDVAFDADAVLKKLDALLLTGNRTNVHPSNYGIKAEPHHEPFDRQRDRASLALAASALNNAIPVLGICRGHQELNIACGGSIQNEIYRKKDIREHQMDAKDNVDDMFVDRHEVCFSKDGYLHQLIGRQKTRVNSLHRQAIDRLGDGLVVEALADDGIIEAVRHTDHPYCIGVQWHPEYQPGENQISEKLFADFAAHAHMLKREIKK